MPAPDSYTLSDLWMAFFNGGTDAEYAAMLAFFDAGLTWADVMGAAQFWHDNPEGGGGGGGVSIEDVQDIVNVHATARTEVTGASAVQAHGAVDATSNIMLYDTPGGVGGTSFARAEGNFPASSAEFDLCFTY